MTSVIIYIRKFLLEPIQPLWRYCLMAVPIALFPTLGLFIIACGILSFIGVNVTELLLQKPSIVTDTSVIGSGKPRSPEKPRGQVSRFQKSS
jgi:hypothetical protein